MSRPGVRVSSVAARVKARRLSAMDMVRGFPVLDGGTVAVSCGGIQQGNEAGFDGVGLYLQDRQRDRQFEATRAGAARVDVETLTTPFDKRFVGVTSDDEFYAGVEIAGNVGDVVDEQGLPAVEGESQQVRDLCGPGAVQIVVAAHGMDGGDIGQPGEDVRVTDVAGVDDLIATLQRGEGLGAEEVVGVGDNDGFHEIHP